MSGVQRCWRCGRVAPDEMSSAFNEWEAYGETGDRVLRPDCITPEEYAEIDDDMTLTEMEIDVSGLDDEPDFIVRIALGITYDRGDQELKVSRTSLSEGVEEARARITRTPSGLAVVTFLLPDGGSRTHPVRRVIIEQVSEEPTE